MYRERGVGGARRRRPAAAPRRHRGRRRRRRVAAGARGARRACHSCSLHLIRLIHLVPVSTNCSHDSKATILVNERGISYYFIYSHCRHGAVLVDKSRRCAQQLNTTH